MTRPTDWVNTRPRLGTLLGGDSGTGEGQDPAPSCCDTDATLPDRADGDNGGTAWAQSSGTLAFVQKKTANNANTDSTIAVTLDAAATAGNLLIAFYSARTGSSSSGAVTPSGWTRYANDFSGPAFDGGASTIFYRTAAGGETTITITKGGSDYASLEVSEYSGNLTYDTGADSDSEAATTSLVTQSITPAGTNVLLYAAFNQSARTATYTWGGSFTELSDVNVYSSGPSSTSGYRLVTGASGSYTGSATSTESDGYGRAILAFTASGSAWSVRADAVNDGDDATYYTVTGTDLIRIDLGAAHRIVSTRIRIAANTSGARTFTIKGANAVDFSDEVTLATIAFTATGSYTAQDVEATWTNTTDYRYYELSIGTSDTYRIHSWELYEGTLATDLAAHTGDTSDAHDASAISIADSGGHFTATDVEGALAELASSAGGFGWFDVTDYGAVGDGVTDDASAINDAITALNAAGGGVLYLPHASDAYRITSALTSITVACVVRGDGAAAFPYATGTGSRIEQASDTANVFTFTDPGWVIEDLAIINTEGNPSAGAGIVASTTGPLYARMNRIQVGGFYDCVDLSGNGRWTLTDSYIYDPVRYGIRIRGDDDGDHSISGCYIMSDVHDGTAAIRQEGAGGLKVVNTKINERGVSGGEFVDGISVSIGAGITTSVLLVANTSIENVTGDGIDIATVSTGFFGLVTIVGCEILATGNTGRAVKIAAATNGELPDAGAISGVVIASNVFRTDGTPRAAIELTNTDRVTMSANVYIGFDDLYTASGDTNTEVTGGASFATPSIVLGSSAAGGAASTVIRSDATIAAFDATSPTTQAFGDSAATGSVAFAARRDHKHGMPSAPAPPAVLLVSGHAVPFTFDEILQESDGSDFLHASA